MRRGEERREEKGSEETRREEEEEEEKLVSTVMEGSPLQQTTYCVSPPQHVLH